MGVTLEDLADLRNCHAGLDPGARPMSRTRGSNTSGRWWYHARVSELTLSPGFASFVRAAIADGDARTYSIPGYRAQVAAWLTWCREHSLDPETATPSDIRSYQRHLAADSSQRYAIPHKLLVLRWFYQSLVQAGLRKDNPAAGTFPTHGC